MSAQKTEAAAPAKQQPKAKPAKKGGEAKEAAPVMAVSDGRETKHATPRLKTFYHEKVVPSLMESRGLKNPFQVPRLVKVVINSGVSAARENVQILDSVRYDLAMLAGQWPQIRKATKSISNFKLRMGMPIGLRVTLRGDRMYEFLDRLISVASPRLRDFRGLDARGFDGRGNYNLGLRDQMIFPEVNVEKALRQQGMNITIVTTAGKDDLGMELLRMMGMPFKAAAGGN